jgi:D-sedoheptulose 7-phosphate isomerase
VKTRLAAQEAISEIIRESLSLKQAILDDSELIDTVAKVASQMVRAFQDGRKVLFLGNGGSAADAQHLAAEFVGRFKKERRALAALALTTDSSAMTAIGNDYSYERVFARQLEALGSSGDVAVGISTSGNSPNVLAAIRVAKMMGIITVGLTGLRGGDLRSSVDYCMCVPSDRTPRVQEAHILIGHILCEIVEEELFHEGHLS